MSGLNGDTCDRCEREFHVIFRVPTEVWNEIAPDPSTLSTQQGGILCPDCAAIAAERIGQRLYFEAVTGWWCISELRDEIADLRAQLATARADALRAAAAEARQTVECCPSCACVERHILALIDKEPSNDGS